MRKLRMIAVIGCLALMVGACGDTGGQDSTTAGASATTTGETEEDTTTTESTESESQRIVLADTAGISFSRLPSYANRDRLNDEGWEIETVQFSAEDLKAEALSSGTVNIARSDWLNSMRALLAGGDFVAVAVDRPDEFVSIARADLADCSELEGKTLANQSEGSTNTTFYMYWLENKCGVTDFNQIFISGGENRIISLLNGEIDGTIVQMADFINLDRQAPGEFVIQAKMGEEIPGLAGALIWVNKPWLAENRDLVVEYVAEVFKDNRAANNDGSAIRATAELYQSEADVALFDVTHEIYTEELGGWPECGVVTPESTTNLITLFEDLGILEPGLEAEDMIDFSVLEDARAAVDFCD